MKKTLLNLAILSLTVIGLGSCMSTADRHKQVTSYNVGCETKNVLISGETFELNGTENWTAECDGKTYYCTYLEESGSDCYEVRK